VFETEPVLMLYKIPDTVAQIAWNGMNLFYISGKEEKKLHKCAGDIKRADFGKEIFSVSHEFNLRF